MAAEVDRGVTVGSESETVEPISCNIGGDIHTCPCTSGEVPYGTKRYPHRGSIVVIDPTFGPRVVTDGANLIASCGGTICMNTQNGTRGRTGQALHIEAQVAADVW